MSMNLYWNPETDPAYNLALEECMTRSLRGPGILLWRNRNAVIIGRNQNTLAEINTDLLREWNITAVRRNTGGGTVYHDLGNLNYSCMADVEEETEISFEVFAQPILAALRSLGVPCVFSGRNDILYQDKKVSGTAKTVINGRLLFHGTLLFDTDLSVLGKILTPDPEKIRGKGIKSVRARVENLKEALPGMTSDQFTEAMCQALLQHSGISALTPIPEDLRKQAERLAQEKYRTHEWNYGNSPFFSFRKKQRFAAGTVEVLLDVRRGNMEQVAIRGDFFGEAPVADLENALRGSAHDPESIRRCLESIDLHRYINGLSLDEFVTLFI